MNTTSAVNIAGARPVQFPIPANVYAETVVSVKHYTDRLFSFRITRPQSLRFRSGEFVMIGLPNAEKPIFRAYSVASPAWDDELEFFSIKVPDGPLTSELQKIQATPEFQAQLLRFGMEPSAQHSPEQFAAIIKAEQPLIGELTGGRVTLYNSTTREESPRMGRITALIGSGKFYSDLGIDKLNPQTDRIMICGSMHMLKDVKELAESLGFQEGSLSHPATFVVERAFVG